MKQEVVIILLISGLSTLSSCLSHQYHFVNIPKSWSEAQRYCRENYADLANIDNHKKMEALMEAVDYDYNGDAWIGLYEYRDSWQWSDRFFYGELETEFRNWESGRPQNSGKKQSCAVMTTTGTWEDVLCDKETSRPFVCSDEDATERYILIEEKKNWEKAQKYCRKEHTDLASVRSQSENQEIKDMINSSAWIGLFRESGKWWSDHSNWTPGQPDNAGENESCAAVSISDSGRWGDHDCDNMLPFFCHEDNLILVHENKSWDEALHFCRKHYRDLASVPTEEVQRSVELRAQSASTAHVWLGLNYSCKLHFWFWLDGRIVTKEEEAMECGVKGAIQSGEEQMWVIRHETEKLNFICSKCGGD